MDTLLITGGERTVARHFGAVYKDKFHIRYFTTELPVDQSDYYYWQPMKGIIDYTALHGVDHILHLSGVPIYARSWSTRYRDEIVTSRAGATALIGRALAYIGERVRTFVSASSIDYYGLDRGRDPFVETDPPGEGFLPELCMAWEEEASLLQYEGLADRVVVARHGVPFCHYAGALPKIAFGTSHGMAFVLGSGQQIIPWVHINDLCRAYRFMLSRSHVEGVYNVVAPTPTSYRTIVNTLARLRSDNYMELPAPGAFIKRYMEASAKSFYRGARISCQRLLDAGFAFAHPEIEDALTQIYDL